MEEISVYLRNIIGTVICLLFVRIFIVYQRIHRKKKIILSRFTAKLMIVLGSGGHTFEMLHLIRNVTEKIRPRIYIIADSDKLSEQKAISFEETKNKSVPPELYVIEKIPRSREVGQSWLSTVLTTFKSCIRSLFVVFKHMPDAVLCNGPGTCIPVCLSALFLHILGLKIITIIYVESICRVKTLSLSGKILYHMADYFYINWPELLEKYPRAQYMGRLI